MLFNLDDYINACSSNNESNDTNRSSSLSTTNALNMVDENSLEDEEDDNDYFPNINEDDLDSQATTHVSSSSSLVTLDELDDDESYDDRSKYSTSNKRTDKDMQTDCLEMRLKSLNDFKCSSKCYFRGDCARRLTIAEACEIQKQFWGIDLITTTADRGEKIFNLILAAKCVDDRKPSLRDKSGSVLKFTLSNPLAPTVGKTKPPKQQICEGIHMFDSTNCYCLFHLLRIYSTDAMLKVLGLSKTWQWRNSKSAVCINDVK